MNFTYKKPQRNSSITFNFQHKRKPAVLQSAHNLVFNDHHLSFVFSCHVSFLSVVESLNTTLR